MGEGLGRVREHTGLCKRVEKHALCIVHSDRCADPGVESAIAITKCHEVARGRNGDRENARRCGLVKRGKLMDHHTVGGEETRDVEELKSPHLRDNKDVGGIHR